VAIQYGVDRAAGRDLHRVRQSPQQALANLAGSPVRFLAPGCNDCRFHLLGQLIGIAERPARSIAQTFPTTLLVTLEDLVAGLPRNAELATQASHAFPVLEPDHKAHSSITELSFHGIPSFHPLAGRKV